MCFLVAWLKIIRYQLQGFYVLYKESLCNHACICQLCCDECLHIAFGKCSGKSDTLSADSVSHWHGIIQRAHMSKFPELDYLSLILPCISQKPFITSFFGEKNITHAAFNCNSLHQLVHCGFCDICSLHCILT